MPTAFRVAAADGGPFAHADTIEEILDLARGSPPGRYRIDEIWLDRATGDLRCWEWGELIRGPDGATRLELPPRPDRGRPTGLPARMSHRPRGLGGPREPDRRPPVGRRWDGAHRRGEERP